MLEHNHKSKIRDQKMGTKEQQHWSWISSSGLTSAIFVCFILFTSIPSATPTSLSVEIMEPRLTTGRSLLQAQKGCPVNFENLNYTIITSKCKGPKYPAKLCCDAFKGFACPYADQLNDQTNNCATTMFSYINLYGKYPPGLFANECRDSKRGLECTDAQSKAQISSATPSSSLFSLFSLSIATLLPILLLLV